MIFYVLLLLYLVYKFRFMYCFHILLFSYSLFYSFMVNITHFHFGSVSLLWLLNLCFAVNALE